MQIPQDRGYVVDSTTSGNNPGQRILHSLQSRNVFICYAAEEWVAIIEVSIHMPRNVNELTKEQQFTRTNDCNKIKPLIPNNMWNHHWRVWKIWHGKLIGFYCKIYELVRIRRFAFSCLALGNFRVEKNLLLSGKLFLNGPQASEKNGFATFRMSYQRTGLGNNYKGGWWRDGVTSVPVVNPLWNIPQMKLRRF